MNDRKYFILAFTLITRFVFSQCDIAFTYFDSIPGNVNILQFCSDLHRFSVSRMLMIYCFSMSFELYSELRARRFPKRNARDTCDAREL